MKWARVAERLIRCRKLFSLDDPQARSSLLSGKLFDDSGLIELSVEEAYSVQKLVEEAEADAVVGFKVANTNETSRAFLSVTKPFFGPILSKRTQFVSPGRVARIKTSSLNVGLVEPEIGLVLGKDLPPLDENGTEKYSFEQVVEAVEAVVGSLEIIHTSFLDWRSVGAPGLIADLASNGSFIFGEPYAPADRMATLTKLKDISCQLSIDCQPVAHGEGSRALGDPLLVLEWLCNELLLQSRGSCWLRKGDIISTGVLVDPPYQYAQPGQTFRVEYSLKGLSAVEFKCS